VPQVLRTIPPLVRAEMQSRGWAPTGESYQSYGLIFWAAVGGKPPVAYDPAGRCFVVEKTDLR
jgi:hypothetical protein